MPDLQREVHAKALGWELHASYSREMIAPRFETGTKGSGELPFPRKDFDRDEITQGFASGLNLGCHYFLRMSSHWRNALIVLGAIVLVGFLTAEYWAQALANAVVDQVLVPLTQLIVDILT